MWVLSEGKVEILKSILDHTLPSSFTRRPSRRVSPSHPASFPLSSLRFKRAPFTSHSLRRPPYLFHTMAEDLETSQLNKVGVPYSQSSLRRSLRPRRMRACLLVYLLGWAEA